MKLLSFLLFLSAVLVSATSKAQKDIKIRFENVQKQCTGFDQSKKLKVAVARFNVTTPRAPGEFGANMATMLTNALQQTNCFRVLAQLKNLDDLKDEIEFKKNENNPDDDGPKEKKMMSAQAVVTGEITEFSRQEKAFGLTILKKVTIIVKIGFILQIINPETREIISSKSINVDAKVASAAVAGTFIPYIGALNIASGLNVDPAIGNALEQGIIESVEFMAREKESFATVTNPQTAISDAANNSTATLNFTDYAFLSVFADTIRKISGVTNVQKTFKGNSGTIKIAHTGTTEDLVNGIIKVLGTKVEVISLSDGKFTLTVK
jgi:curli biogenesis system outer membrane secretion channel CsgG